jgi:predicted DCC family thiol-disulfide oxidoreductase YuxK
MHAGVDGPTLPLSSWAESNEIGPEAWGKRAQRSWRASTAASPTAALVALTRLPGIRHMLDVAYAIFAKNRLRLTGRCTKDSCA